MFRAPGWGHLSPDPSGRLAAALRHAWALAPAGKLLQGSYACFSEPADAVACVLSAADGGLGVGLDEGPAWIDGVPAGPAAARAWALADVARAGEVLAPEPVGRRLPWPPGVGCFAAPSALAPGAGDVRIFRDLR